MGYPLLLGIVIIGIGVGVAIAYAMRPHEQQSSRETPEPDISRIHRQGPCSHCNGDVDDLNGCKLECNHFLHYTCMANLKREFGAHFNSNVLCKLCMNYRVKNQGGSSNNELRNRRTASHECANCRKSITASKCHTMKCKKHHVHESCWTRMQEGNLTTCPKCVEEM